MSNLKKMWDKLAHALSEKLGIVITPAYCGNRFWREIIRNMVKIITALEEE